MCQMGHHLQSIVAHSIKMKWLFGQHAIIDASHSKQKKRKNKREKLRSKLEWRDSPIGPMNIK